jgi:hypothetical protein
VHPDGRPPETPIVVTPAQVGIQSMPGFSGFPPERRSVVPE